MNEAFVAHLRERIAVATRTLEEAKRELAAAEAKAQQAVKQIGAYQGTLDFELAGTENLPVTGTNGPNTAMGAIPINGAAPNAAIESLFAQLHEAGDGENEDGESNAILVRKFFRDRAARGVRPHDLNRFFEDTGMTVHKNYAYSILARLKRRREITARNGRYFATALLLDRIAPEPIAIEKEVTVATS
jgi:hypothetical protein